MSETACSQLETSKRDPHSHLPDILPQPKQTAIKLLFEMGIPWEFPLTSSYQQSRLPCPSWCVRCSSLSVPSQAIAAQRHESLIAVACTQAALPTLAASPAITPDTAPCMGGISNCVLAGAAGMQHDAAGSCTRGCRHVHLNSSRANGNVDMLGVEAYSYVAATPVALDLLQALDVEGVEPPEVPLNSVLLHLITQPCQLILCQLPGPLVLHPLYGSVHLMGWLESAPLLALAYLCCPLRPHKLSQNCSARRDGVQALEA